jgi:phosphatidate phosphatase PAH1
MGYLTKICFRRYHLCQTIIAGAGVKTIAGTLVKLSLVVFLFSSAAFSGGVANLKICDQASVAENVPLKPWRHASSELLSWFSAFHMNNDILVAFGQDALIPGKFSYGTLSKDLEDEEIEVWIDRCSSVIQLLGSAITDDDGRSNFTIKASQIKVPGVYKIYQRVAGDNTWVASTLRVLPRGSHLAVFDIDGTLTTSDSEMQWAVWKKLLSQKYDPVARRGAREVTQAWYEAGNEIVYLSGRHYALTDMSRQWLAGKDMAPGTLLVGQSISEIMPNNEGVGMFKLQHLNAMKRNGFVINAAYGNAMTDVFSYEQAGMAKSATYIVGEYGGSGGTVNLGNDFLRHLQEL